MIFAAQGMEPQPRQVHIPWLMRCVQPGKDEANPVCMLRLNTGLAAGFVKTGNPVQTKPESLSSQIGLTSLMLGQ